MSFDSIKGKALLEVGSITLLFMMVFIGELSLGVVYQSTIYELLTPLFSLGFGCLYLFLLLSIGVHFASTKKDRWMEEQATFFHQKHTRQKGHNVSPRWKDSLKPIVLTVCYWYEEVDSKSLVRKQDFFQMGKKFCERENTELFESAFAAAWKCFSRSRKYQGGETKKRREKLLGVKK